MMASFPELPSELAELLPTAESDTGTGWVYHQDLGIGGYLDYLSGTPPSAMRKTTSLQQ
jgi:hypothetical protein